MTKKNILLVDSETLILEMFEYALKAENYNVIKARDSYEGIQLLLQNHIDLMFCETELKDGYGFSLATIALSIHPRISIMISDKSYSHLNYNRASVFGYNYLAKPIAVKELVNSVNTMLKEEVEHSYKLAS